MIHFIFKTKSFPSVRGFTLIELLVSMALFTSIITIAVGALFSAQTINTKLEQTQLILDGVNLATEIMARDLRYGTTFFCTVGAPSNVLVSRQSCPYGGLGGSAIIFRPSVTLAGSTDPSKDRVVYYVLNGSIYKDEYKEGNILNKRTFQITPSDVNIKNLVFYVTGAEESGAGTDADLNQPLVTLVVSGVTVPNRARVEPVPFTLQTSVSSRGLDI